MDYQNHLPKRIFQQLLFIAILKTGLVVLKRVTINKFAFKPKGNCIQEGKDDIGLFTISDMKLVQKISVNKYFVLNFYIISSNEKKIPQTGYTSLHHGL